MNLSVIFNAIVPDNIKDIELVKKCSNIFIEQLNRNSTISRRIADIFDVDKKTWLQQDTIGNITEVTDSDFLIESKNILKQGLFQVYLNVLYNLVEKIQMDPNVKEATDIRHYEGSLIYKNIYDVLTSEYLGAFRYFQQNSGTKNAIKYIYQFAKYLETGYLSSDLELNDETGVFVLQYKGSLHKRYFSAFNQPMAHPCGWCYEYATIISWILEDYFGIVFEYKMPRGISIKTSNLKYIVFSDETIEDFYESLKSPMNVVSENALTDDRIAEIKELPYTYYDGSSASELKKLLRTFNIIIVNKKYSKYSSYTEINTINKIIYFDDNTCLYFNGFNIFFGNASDIYEIDKMEMFPNGFFLNIGTEEQIEASKTIKILYRDELNFEIESEIGKSKNSGYYKNSLDAKFHLLGNSYPFVPGIDESRHKVTNYEQCKKNFECFNAQISAKLINLTYLSVSDDFGHHYTTTEENFNKNIVFNTHGWYNHGLNFVALNANSYDYDFYLKTNTINFPSLTLKINSLKTTNFKIEINGFSKTNATWKLVVLGHSDKTGSITSGNFSVIIDTSQYESHVDYYLEIKNSDDIFKIESNGINHIENFKFGFTVYSGSAIKPLFVNCTPDTMLEINSGNKVLTDFSLCELPVLFTNTEPDGYILKGNIAEPKKYWDLKSETWDGLTYVDEGFEFIKTDSDDCYVPDSTEYVDDDFDCYIMGYGHYLTFLNDDDEGSDSQGKYLVTRFNQESKNKEGIRGFICGLILTTSE